MRASVYVLYARYTHIYLSFRKIEKKKKNSKEKTTTLSFSPHGLKFPDDKNEKKRKRE